MSVILIRILRVLAVLFILRLALRLWAQWQRAKHGRPGPGDDARARGARPPAAPSVELVRDRVCNTFLPRELALVARVAGQSYYFCSTRCRDQALAAARAS